MIVFLSHFSHWIQLVLIFKWAFGSHDDLTLRGYARAQLLIVLFAIILGIGLVVLMMLMPDLLDQVAAEI